MKLIPRAAAILSVPVLVGTLAACGNDDVDTSSDSTVTFSEQAGGDVVSSSSSSETEEPDVEDARPTGPSDIEGIETFVDAEPALKDVEGVTFNADDGSTIRCTLSQAMCVADNGYWTTEVNMGIGVPAAHPLSDVTSLDGKGGSALGAKPSMPAELPVLEKGQKAEFIAPGGATNQYGYIAWDGVNIVYATVPDPLAGPATINVITPDKPLQAPQQ